MSNNNKLIQQLEECLLREKNTKQEYSKILQQKDLDLQQKNIELNRAAVVLQRIINERDAAVDELERYKNLVRTGILGGKKRKIKRKKRRTKRRRKKYKSKK